MRKYHRQLSINIFHLILITLLSFGLASRALAAISVNKSTYTFGEPIVLTSSGAPYQIYDLTANTSRGGSGSFSAGDLVSFDTVNNHQYALVEVSQDGLCEDEHLTYLQCKAAPEFLSETTFTVGVSSPSGPAAQVGGPISYRPEVAVLSPRPYQVSSSTVFINYQATDQNDQDSPGEKERLGLADNPVSVFYSLDSDVRRRVLIAKDLPAIGSISWDSIGLKDGDTYFVIVSATDKINEVGEGQAGPFTIDHSVPLFKIKTDPVQTKGEDVAITVESSKDLVEMPILNVTQNNFIPTPVPLNGSKRNFSGIYKVISGYNGIATISISGVDDLNNISSKIVSGGFFGVGELIETKPVAEILKEKSGIKAPKVLEAGPLSASLLYPREGRGVGGVAEIVWSVDDEHAGNVKNVTLSYRKAGGTYQIISSGGVNRKILWDVRDLKEDHDYEIRLEVSDGKTMSEVTRRIFIDNTSPSLEVRIKPHRGPAESFSLEATGQATDKLSGIDFVEYSLDGEHWFKADMKGGVLKNKADFSLKYPYKLEDGISIVRYRAVDGAGNISLPFISKIVLDANPPRIGSYLISMNNMILTPSVKQRFEVLEGENLNFKISLEQDTASASLRVGDSELALNKDPDGLWTTELGLLGLGDNEVLISASDSQGHAFVDKPLGKIIVKERGTVSPGSEVSVFVLNEDEKGYVRWQGEEFGTPNPFIADPDGKYSLFLPPGKYYLKVQKDGFEKIRSEKFEVKTSGYIDIDFRLVKLEGLRGLIEPIIDKLMFYEN